MFAHMQEHTFHLHRSLASIRRTVNSATLLMYWDFFVPEATRQPIQCKSPKSSVNLPGRYKLKRQDMRRGRDTLSREIKSGIRGQVRRRQDRDVLKCRARKGCRLWSREWPYGASCIEIFQAGSREPLGELHRRNIERGRGDAPGDRRRRELSGMDDAERRVECNCWAVEVCARRHRQRHFCRDLPSFVRVSLAEM